MSESGVIIKTIIQSFLRLLYKYFLSSSWLLAQLRTLRATAEQDTDSTCSWEGHTQSRETDSKHGISKRKRKDGVMKKITQDDALLAAG